VSGARGRRGDAAAGPAQRIVEAPMGNQLVQSGQRGPGERPAREQTPAADSPRVAAPIWFCTTHLPDFGRSKSLWAGRRTIGRVPAPTVELDAQYRLLREEAGAVPRTGRAWIEVVGADAAEFLQGQLTNDIEALGAGEGCYAALLDRKGKMRSDMRVLMLSDDLITIDVPAVCAEEVIRHLDTYRIGRDVEIRPREDLALLSVIGPRSVEVLGGTPFGVEHAHRSERIAEHDVRLIATYAGADLVGPAPALQAVAEQLAALGAETASEAAAEILRVEAGRPEFGAEMGHDTIPQEAGINERAVSFEKGCYIGQETVARLHFKGKPNRHLRRLSAETPMTAGAPVAVGEKEVGMIGTAVISPDRGPLALAILRREAEPGAEVRVGDAISATVEEADA